MDRGAWRATELDTTARLTLRHLIFLLISLVAFGAFAFPARRTSNNFCILVGGRPNEKIGPG